MVRRTIVIGAILSSLLSLFPALAGAQPSAARLCFDPSKTTKCIEGRFLDYWNAHGGLAINGYPLTDERLEPLTVDANGKKVYYWVQWFERVRMEYHEKNAGTPSEVLLGQFGRDIHPADPPVARQPGMQYFDPTGHNVPADFMRYWNANGGLPQFGYPLSEIIQEQLPINPQGDLATFEVQYFERARFERHPGNLILLGQFGRRILTAPWGPVLTPLGGDSFTHNDPQGRYTVRIPNAWNAKTEGNSGNVFFRQPGPDWGAEVAINDGAAYSVIDQAADNITEQVNKRPAYRPISFAQVNVGPHKATRRVFQHLNSDVPPRQEVIVRIDFLVGPRLYTVNAFMEPHDLDRLAPLVDSIAGSVVDNP